MITWPPTLRLVRRAGAIWVDGLYDPTDERFPPGPYRGPDTEAVADAHVDIAIVTEHYTKNRAAYRRHALEFETYAEEAELWAETVRDRPAPTYGTPGWYKMYACFIDHVFTEDPGA